jgi:ribonuclease VapC
MFVDASAIIAILAKEPEQPLFRDKLNAAMQVIVSPMSVYEASLGFARILDGNFILANSGVRDFLIVTKAQVVPIDAAIGDMAFDAFRQYGKGRHEAALNMGDCFSYACAKVHRVPLLFKGDDFSHTDILSA